MDALPTQQHPSVFLIAGRRAVRISPRAADFACPFRGGAAKSAARHA
jgi:hypothetical protein